MQNWTAGVATTTAESTTANNTVTAATTLTASADLVLSKVASTLTPSAGGTISYTVTLVNLGPSVALNVTLTDAMSAGLTLSGTPVVTGGSLASSNTSGATATVASLAVNQTLTMVINATVTASTGTVTNTAAGTSTTPDPTPPAPVPVPTPVTPVADVSTTLSVTANGTPGSAITATATFTNNGPSTADNVTATIVLPSGATQTVVIGSLASGANTVTVVTYTVPAGSTTVQNWTAGVATTTAERTTANNTVTAVTALNPLSDVQTTLSVTGNGTPGSTITATATFSNNGPSTAQNVTGTIVPPNGITQTVVIGNLSTGASLSKVVTFVVPNSPTAGVELVFIAGVATTTVESSYSNNTVSVSVEAIRLADLSTTLVVTPQGVPGSTASLTVTYSNIGPTVARDVVGAVVLPDGSTQTFAIGRLADGRNIVYTLTYAVPQSTDTQATLVWVAGISTSTPEVTLANNTVTVVTTINPLTDVATTISVTPNGTPGAVINATVTFTNNGPSTAQNVTGTIVLPGGTTQTVVIGSLNAGANTVTLVSYTVPNGSITVQNWTAGVATTTAESTTANNTVTAVTALNPLVDVVTTISVPATAEPGATIQVTITFANLGPSVAQFVTGTLSLPNGSSTVVFSANAMPPGSSTVVVVPYPVPTAQSSDMRWTATVATISPEVNLGNNVATGVTGVGTVTNASVSGFVWYDLNRNRIFDSAPIDQPLAGFRVELLKGTEVVGSATTAINGSYQITGQIPGAGYALRFLDPTGKQVYGTPFSQSTLTLNSNPSTGTNSLTSAVSPGQQVPVAGVINNVTLYAGDNVILQNLPVDPSGVVYDSVTRQPITGASVTLNGPAGFDPAVHLVGKSDVSTTGVNGFYQFLLTGNAPSGPYTLSVKPPAGYAATPATQGGVTSPGVLNPVPPGVTLVQPQSTPPAVGVNGAATGYYLGLTYNVPASGEVFNNHIPLDPIGSGAILITKVGNKTIAEMGDSVQYTIRLRNTSNSNITNVVLQDVLPQGFRYIASTARLFAGAGTSTIAEPTAGSARQLNFNIGAIPGNGSVELSYYLRVGVGAQQGDGINRATAVFPGPGGKPVSSNTAQFKVVVQGGVFTSRGCVIGKVYVDCDGNHMQNADGGPNEVGIPGVRLVMLDGSFVITDVEGKYSLCGLSAQTHVLKIDRSTLPVGARMVPSSNRNAGVGDSLFIDMRGGELARGDFIEGSCSREINEQVRVRRERGAVVVPLAPVTPLVGIGRARP